MNNIKDSDTVHRFFGSHGLALHCIDQTLNSAVIIRIATAYFEPSGYQCLQDVLEGKQVHLLVGRQEGGRDRAEEIIHEFTEHLTSRPLDRRLRAMRLMLNGLEQGLLAVSVDNSIEHISLLDARYLYQHAKLYIADDTAAVVTSANMSYHGLVTSREAGFRVTEHEDVCYFVERFDEYFEKAESITDDLIEILRAWVNARTPFEVYSRALIELYGLPEDEIPPQLVALSGYQRPVVARMLQSMKDYKGAMLIASTGLGKTVMAAHIVAYLRMQGDINRVIIFCPAGLRETWRRFMRAAVTSSTEFSYTTLSGDEPQRNHSLRMLLYELRTTDPQTLVILDESHHMRNSGKKMARKHRYQRIENIVHEQGAQILMLTATPFSRGIKDVNAQLGLISKSTSAVRGNLIKGQDAAYWKIDNAEELSELDPCAVLTTPTVVRHFSQQDLNGERYVLFAADDARYFPRRLKIRTETYVNPLDDLLVELLTSGLLNIEKPDKGQLTLFDDFTAGQAAGLVKSHVLHQFCSSSAQAEQVLGKLSKKGGFKKTRFARQDELSRFVRKRIEEVKRIQHPGRDEKLRKVLDIIKGAEGEKVVIFCQYIATAKALTDAINQNSSNTRAETTAAKDFETVHNLIRSFAPEANDVDETERLGNEIQVLVATGALAEGFNLQDASILINYDLPWTVLVLAQRMGRILRPWKTPREITIYNLIPSTMGDPRLNMAMNWQRRLMERSHQYRSFADIPVLLDVSAQGHEDGLEMASLARNLQSYPEVDLNLDETLEFIQKAENLQTSSFLNDLAHLTNEDRDHVSRLPAGFRSAKLTSGPNQLFVLFEHKKRYYAALFDQRGRIKMDNEERDRIMDEIRCSRSEPKASTQYYPDDDVFDNWLELARAAWANARGFDIDSITIVCSLAMISKVRR